MEDYGQQLFKGDDGNALRFYYQPLKNNFQSERAGRSVFDKVLYVDVLTPGSNESVPTFELERIYCEETGVTEPERSTKYMQYQRQIEAFKANNGEGAMDGTPITAWPQIDVAQVANLRAQNIHTVEQLAAVTDGNLTNLGMGGRVLREQAIAYLNTRQFSVPSAQMAAETANLRDENARLQNEVTDLNNRLTAALADVQRMRVGQPPQTPAPGAPPIDPFSPGTISQPDPLATLSSSSASPLTPTEDETKKGAEMFANIGSQGTPSVI